MLTEHYQNSLTIEYWNENIYPVSEEVRRQKIFAPRAARVLELCQSFGVGNDLLIDLGAGFGTFLEELEKLGHFEETIAVEPSSKLAESCRLKNLTVQEELAENLELESLADVITNFELVEHLYCPMDFLKHCSRLLKPGGLLILTTPNALGFDLLVLGPHSDNIGAPNHINYFNPRSLATLLNRAGFDVIETLTPGELDVDIVQNKIEANAFSLLDQPFLHEVLVENGAALKQAFQSFLADNKLSSHLWVVAKKN
jgi:2-polyprenyl-3-methyl-5-hydroxy-6-metoxy-1,4-benzoquinol methylase